MSADFTIRLVDEGGGAMPANPSGPPARPPGESAVPGKPKKGADDGVSETRTHLQAIGRDIADLLGLTKVVDFAAKMRETFDHAVSAVNSMRRPSGSSDDGGINSKLPTIPPVKPSDSPTSLVPTKTPAPPVTGPTGLPIHHAPRETAGPPVPASRVVGPAAGAEGAAGAISSITAAVGPAAIAIGAFTVAAVAGGYAIKKAFDALSAEVGKLQEYSAPVAAAQGRNEVRAEMSLIRRGEEIGPQLGKFADDMGKMQEAAAEVWTQMLKALLQIYEAVRPIVELVTKMLGMVASGVELTQASIASLMAEFTADAADNKAAAEAIVKASKRFADVMEDGEIGKNKIDPMLATLLASWGHAAGSRPVTGRKPRRVAGGNGGFAGGFVGGLMGGLIP